MEVMSTCLFPREVKCISKNISSITIFVDIYFCLIASNELGQLIQSCNLGLRIWQKPKQHYLDQAANWAYTKKFKTLQFQDSVSNIEILKFLS